jgi:hypothetical protein
MQQKTKNTNVTPAASKTANCDEFDACCTKNAKKEFDT